MVSWVLWSGLYKPLILGLGVFSCLLSTYLATRMGFFRHKFPLRTLLRLPGYWWWLLLEIVKSSIDVARVVLSPSMPISPTVVELKSEGLNDAGKVILGNSITLSPGTVTIDLYKDTFLVHCLTKEGAQALQEQEAQRRVQLLGLN
ncbi:sodium:proton antiporter [Halieaceae bacterium IMCC14734]|uniref:Sodium:proton antiporter n=2 Tax=Candidatus Litorirhabdus singularis TaxID=2518993 RepID=A0ABT3TEA1_9GAMM|nr:sodium:proton antiporter [Candidatus Litorirhabdus singularis]